MITIYFSGTGNSEYLAKQFHEKMKGGTDSKAGVFSIEEDVDFVTLLKENDTVCFCYPIYGSRVPLIMRKFVRKYLEALKGKKLIIFATQYLFSGDGARVFVDMLPKGHVQVIYAEHFFMPNNVCNFIIFPKGNNQKNQRVLEKAEEKLERVCQDIKQGIIRKRGFNIFSTCLGGAQGLFWQGKSSSFTVNPNTGEAKMTKAVYIHKDCTKCNLCVQICPMKNLSIKNERVIHHKNCTGCYRCVNQCPHQAISIFFKRKPKWQYNRQKVFPTVR